MEKTHESDVDSIGPGPDVQYHFPAGKQDGYQRGCKYDSNCYPEPKRYPEMHLFLLQDHSIIGFGADKEYLS